MGEIRFDQRKVHKNSRKRNLVPKHKTFFLDTVELLS